MEKTRLISSQRHIDDTIVATKLADEDYDVIVSPEIIVDGVASRVVIDGHHSYAAAKIAGVEPELVEATIQDYDAIDKIGNVDEFLRLAWSGDDQWYDIDTGKDIW